MNQNSHPDKGRQVLKPVAKAAGITLVAFLFSYFLTSPFSASTSALFSSTENKDFEFSDLYAQVADGRPVRKLEDRVVVVDIGNSNREEIAETLEIISLCEPKQVALDINFEYPGEDDNRLLSVLESLPELILPLGVEESGEGFQISDKPFFYGELPNARYGIVNFPTKGSKTAVREFAIDFPLTDGSRLPSLVVAMAEGIDPESVKKLRKAAKETGIISYASREIPVIHHDQLEESAEALIGKTVLVGALTEVGDVYRTPLQSNVHGVMIHASALSTILDREEMVKLPDYVDDIIATVICFFIILLAIGMKSKIKGVTIRLVQVVFAILAVRIGYGMYVDHNIIINFSHTLLMIAFGLFAVDIWSGGEYVYDKISKIIRNRHKLKLKCRESY